jgi:flavin-dependent dehydrogenase
MTSGSIAADTAIVAIKAQKYNARVLSQYEQQWRSEIGDDLMRSVEIQQRFFNDSGRRLDWLVQNAASDPELLKLIVDYSTGATKYEKLQSYMMRSTVPKWVWGKVKAASGLFSQN